MIGLQSCAESLPVVGDPSNIFSVTVKPYHFVGSNYSYLEFQFVVVYQNYDEVIQGPADFNGVSVLTWLDGPISIARTRTYPITIQNISSINLSLESGILTIKPNDTLIFKTRWDFKTDDSTNIFDHLKKDGKIIEDYRCRVTYQPSDGRQARQISTPQGFLVSFETSLFKQKGKIKMPDYSFRFCLIRPHRSGDCYLPGLPGAPYFPINPENPCEGVIPQ